MELLTAAQMRAVEAAAIASGQVTGLELMERAGRGVVEAIFEEWPELAAPAGGATPGPPEYLDQEERGRRAVVLCGPGNNGGDGFVVARLLRERGWAVEVFLYGDAAKLPPDARVNYERWVAMGEVVAWDGLSVAPLPLHAAVVIDALFGTGLSRASDLLPGAKLRLDECGLGDRFVSIDIPSGLCADSGRSLGAAVLCADLTVTFHRFKLGHVLNDGPDVCGRLRLVDIGLSSLPRLSSVQQAADQAVGGVFYPPVTRTQSLKVGDTVKAIVGAYPICSKASKPEGHKYSHGHALILSGLSGRGGAARLAARGSLRIGAGVVTVGCPPDAIPENAARLDAVMLRAVADGAALAAALEDRRINALCLGPGMGTGVREAGLLAVALGLPGGPPPPSPPHEGEGRHKTLPLAGAGVSGAPSPEGGAGPEASSALSVAGATGSAPPPPEAGEATPRGQPSRTTVAEEALPLPLVGRGEGWGASALRRRLVLDADALTLLSRDPALMGALHEGCVLTPHAGEFARLFPDIAERLAAPATKGPAYSKVDATREAAARAGCVVLFKGQDTVIAGPDGRCAINSAAYERAAPWLATAGSGDVLAGFITGLLARGFAPFEAACAAAWLHVECARSFGPGLIAEDLPEELPKVFRAMGL